jgi:hypothetical protein
MLWVIITFLVFSQWRVKWSKGLKLSVCHYDFYIELTSLRDSRGPLTSRLVTEGYRVGHGHEGDSMHGRAETRV